LREGRLISAQRLRELETPRHKFRPGIHYGLGMMEIRFEGFFFLLRGLPRPTGHIGVLSTFMFHDPVHDAYIAMNMASTRNMPRGFKAIIQIVQALRAVSTATEKQRDL
jgi:D-alanyl-D-alanine carboxypeptidase